MERKEFEKQFKEVLKEEGIVPVYFDGGHILANGYTCVDKLELGDYTTLVIPPESQMVDLRLGRRFIASIYLSKIIALREGD